MLPFSSFFALGDLKNANRDFCDISMQCWGRILCPALKDRLAGRLCCYCKKKSTQEIDILSLQSQEVHLISKTLTCAYFPAIVQHFRYVLIQVSNYIESVHIGKVSKYSLELEGIRSIKAKPFMFIIMWTLVKQETVSKRIWSTC